MKDIVGTELIWTDHDSSQIVYSNTIEIHMEKRD